MDKYDVIIVGAGAAGLTAALYATRRRLKTLVLSLDLGGQTATTMNIENYPGVDFSTGPDLMNNFAGQAKKFGAKLELDEVDTIKSRGSEFEVTTQSKKTYLTRSIILAIGKRPRHLDVPGEEEFRNKGVVYCATCDAPLFEGKTVAVVGGGSAAFDAALLLAKISPKVYLIHRRSEFRAEGVLVERVRQESRIELIPDSEIGNIKGSDFVTSIELKTPDGRQELAVEGVFVEIGQVVGSDFIKDLVKLSDAGEVVIDELNQTSTPGVFAAGDATTVPFKQTVISAGEGAKAALAAYNYLQGRDPRAVSPDQGYVK